MIDNEKAVAAMLGEVDPSCPVQGIVEMGNTLYFTWRGRAWKLELHNPDPDQCAHDFVQTGGDMLGNKHYRCRHCRSPKILCGGA